ncbi:unnamed protein product [Penicillium salamii]|uniref:PRISE-like Rossmann-fold domain-containing protein n=1 Tax=Penicillium salamii TaxID=1612424 RepID=A0A9W4K3I8_9EURO|nr:unnamed protein product [Penicillium salamii]CAG8101422.1 unnamed protein product [Penicillium salamii]CAG8153087.1 unnamed protein product [Penicillium salamii]CAG8163082.1 unnamed protein product [Penicillium salamii]CAG8312730.1 unnamed protein product [Penicillium salamii]
MPQIEKNALVFGASGISGWSLMNQCLQYPSKDAFKSVTGLCNRPLSKQDACLPGDERLKIISGVDLTQSVDTVTEQLKKIENIGSINIVFFCAYIDGSDFDSRRQLNTSILCTTIESLENAGANLETVILQTGGKGYGLEFSQELDIRPPLHENMPRIPEPWRSNVFYYEQYDTLERLSEGGRKWSFSEIRPDGIIGFVPGSNAMNLAQGIAMYLTLYREVNGRGARVPFPGTAHGYASQHSDTFQDILSKMEIFAALNRDRCTHGSSFNVANGEAVSWAQAWPGICAYFGLVGDGPGDQLVIIQDFVIKHQEVWDQLVESHGLRAGSITSFNWPFIHFMLVEFDFDRQYSLDLARSVGFKESIDTVDGYRIAFDRMVKAKLIPSL